MLYVGRLPFVAIALSGLLAADLTEASPCVDVVQNGVTFTFDRVYECGQFANGDWWVTPDAPGGTVLLSQITPDFDGASHGWEVNPVGPSDQGFDTRIASFDAALVPELPYSARGGESIVKGISVPEGSCRPCLDSASILTVLDTPPPGGGVDRFRPPYVGFEKPMIPTARLRLELLPDLDPTPSAPTFADVQISFGQPWLDHKSGWQGRELHPEESMPDYGADIAAVTGDGALALMLSGDAEEKRQAAIRYVQVGLDLYTAYRNGSTWTPNGGHSPGRRLPMAMAATLLDNATMRRVVRTAPETDFGEEGSLAAGENAGIPLWGQPCSDEQYWQQARFDQGNKSCLDPYGYIDGGETPGESYQFCCNSSPFRGHALALRLMPELRCAWPADEFLEYVDRWVERGTHSQPDPCAGYDGDPDGYGITYGPDGLGGCILDTDPSDGVGRHPDLHGSNANDGHHGSVFHGEMWDAYRAQADDSVSPLCALAGEPQPNG